MDDQWHVCNNSETCTFILSLKTFRASSRLVLWMQTSTSHWVASMVSEAFPPLRSLEPIRTSQRNTKAQIKNRQIAPVALGFFLAQLIRSPPVLQVDVVARPLWMELWVLCVAWWKRGWVEAPAGQATTNRCAFVLNDIWDLKKWEVNNAHSPHSSRAAVAATARRMWLNWPTTTLTRWWWRATRCGWWSSLPPGVATAKSESSFQNMQPHLEHFTRLAVWDISCNFCRLLSIAWSPSGQLLPQLLRNRPRAKFASELWMLPYIRLCPVATGWVKLKVD